MPTVIDLVRATMADQKARGLSQYYLSFEDGDALLAALDAVGRDKAFVRDLLTDLERALKLLREAV